MKRLFLLLLSITTGITVFAQLVVNQIGFYPEGPKQAVVINGALNKDFKLLHAETGETVYEGKLGEAIQSKNASLVTRIADFSEFTKPGTYIISSGQFETKAFTIGEKVHQEVAKGVLKGYYYQRASMPLAAQYAGKWARPAGHADDVVYIHASAASKKRPEGTVISAPGGWYDAGDYNKYIVNSGITMGTLLSAYEDFPQYFEGLNVNIPETGNGAPDILNEAVYNLRWMLSMQDPHDGGVYNKLTNANFDAMDTQAHQNKEARYVVQKGTAATLDFAAVTAQSARILRNFPAVFPNLADSCLAASRKAWNWAIKHPDMPYDQNQMNQIYKPEIATGGYGDRNFKDEWFWAAAELYLTTKDNKYQKFIDANSIEKPQIPGWNNVYLLGVYSLLRYKDKIYEDRFATLINELAEEFVNAIPTNAFGVVMGKSRADFFWGSNSLAANQGILLINAYRLTGNVIYLKAAISNADYLLGRNATGYCFLTGFGYRSVRHPHHRPSVSDNVVEPIPGLLAGGPNPGAPYSDGQYYEFTEPETTYADVQGSYASNEIAINWNAPAVYLFGAIEAESKQLLLNLLK
ncbi:MAG: glycoside hydrolase family 9 protein [Dysgonamonadaceae bacterium]|jgi:endoglucanase|nr:glycoside hydrolase family 9 protein [Dysgonamonadaceae bacterium]